MTYSTPANAPIDGMLLYSAVPIDRPPNTLPPIRLDLLPADLAGTLALAHVWYGTAELGVRITDTVAYVFPEPTLFSADRSIADLVAIMPSVNQWLDKWAQASDRNPSHTPPWADQLELAPEQVAHIAEQIVRRLAIAEVRQIVVTDLHGRADTLSVPPLACLVPPRGPAKKAKQYRVDESCELICALTEAGTPVHIPLDLLRDMDLSDDYVLIDFEHVYSLHVELTNKPIKDKTIT